MASWTDSAALRYGARVGAETSPPLEGACMAVMGFRDCSAADLGDIEMARDVSR
jgi:hypothetical protein